MFHIFWTILLFVACTADRFDVTPEDILVTTEDGGSIKESALQKGHIRINVSEETAAAIEADPEAFIRKNAWLNVTSIERTFAEAGEFEERTRRAGLHLWYDVTFDGEIPLTKAGSGLRDLNGVNAVDYIPRIKRPQHQDVSWKSASQTAYSSLAKSPASAATEYFNDPDLKEQWHYYNRGLRVHGAKDGCDINILPVWKNYKCGDENVIVAVVDGGIDYKHNDLADNMWQNPEQTGNKVYGYNFMNDSYVITAEDHGTHVAGIIAAVNNNGIGGCGIAGGDAAAGIPGVRLLSCQIFKQGSDDSGDDIKAIKWAADHGAVICQNSWAYDDTDYMPLSTKKAIDYFNEYAGCDAFGNQTGPIKGGLVVFASGNEASAKKTYPPSYEGVIAVSALRADYRIASYSNYGDWVDIAAPGGDDRYSIYSTISNNRYASYDGTSMAAPHVSGVAALVIANYGGEGFTRDNLITILLNHTTDISGDNTDKYPGVGLLNAHSAIGADAGDPTISVTGFDVRVDGRKVSATVSVSDSAQEASWISTGRIYYSKESFSDTEGIPFFTTYLRTLSSEGPFSLMSEDLEYNTKYYVAAAFTDEFGNCTSLSPLKEIVTVADAAPVIAAQQPQEDIEIHSHENYVLEYEVSDPYGDDVETVLTCDNDEIVVMSVSGTLVKVTIRGFAADVGNYSFTLTATDPAGLQTSLTVPFSVIANTPPRVTAEIDDIIIPGGETITVDLSKHITDADGESLLYTFKMDNPNVIKTSLDGDILTLVPQKYGITSVTVTATDFQDESVSITFSLMVRDQSVAVELYPNPTTDGKLYLRVGVTRSVDVSVVNPAGATIYNQTLTIEPFSPAILDLSRQSAGSYMVTTSTDGESTTRRVVKL